MPDDSPYEPYLIDLRYEQRPLANSLTIYQGKSQKWYLPLRSVSLALGFRLRINLEENKVEGFLRAPSERFSWNLLSKSLTFKRRPAEPPIFFKSDGDLYVESEAFAKIAQLELEWNLNSLALSVSSKKDLSLDRQAYQQAISAGESEPTSTLPKIETPYRLLSVPTVDAQFISQGGAESSSTLSLTAFGDLLYMGATYQTVNAAPGESRSLLSLGRQDPDSNLLGDLHASQFALGDLNLREVPLLVENRIGTGLTLGNGSIGSHDLTKDIHGQSQPDATIELYRKDELIASTRSDSKGNYCFQDVYLEEGPNRLLIVEILSDRVLSERSRLVYGNRWNLEPGQFQYQLTYDRPNSTLFQSESRFRSPLYSDEEAIGQFAWGLPSEAKASATLARLTQDDKTTHYLGLGVQKWQDEFLWSLDSLVSENGGWLLSEGLGAQFGKHHFKFSQVQSFGPQSENTIGGKNHLGTRLEWSVIDHESSGLRSYGVSYSRWAGNSASSQLSAYASGKLGRYDFYHRFNAEYADGFSDLKGFMELRRPLGNTYAKLQATYDLDSDAFLQQASLSFSRMMSAQNILNYGIGVTRGEMQATAGVYRTLGALALGANITVGPEGEITPSLVFTTSFAIDNGLGQACSRPGSASLGRIKARVYLDQNLSGLYEKGEPLIEGVQVKTANRAAKTSTNTSGICQLIELTPDEECAVKIDEDSLLDPAWMPAQTGWRVIPHAGRETSVDLALIETAEIDGRVTLADETPLEGLTASLVSVDGHQIQSLLDEKGTYSFSRVKPGAYELTLVDETGTVLGKRSMQVQAGLATVDWEVPVLSTETHPRD